ncbi:FAD/NAD(P)-binding domain-containing protein [Neolentinus lepideus HHB14362 ss-1]|uniref:FAD/NAD(P)-binding domain-containing protein n=1 Tax=Neolentinus lepideus HHB14362 ss-1 TaxID=1314782 RepID=A0A165VPH5_9AGAM|nr:FAD/NAD(P)-binding domain-containing protein [Neolentinus lepideus HHB14362 ss-1]
MHPFSTTASTRCVPATKTSTKTVAVLGASFGGFHAARILANGLPEDWKVVLIDRNSHVNHLYVFPRYAVLAGHEHKAFIPPTHVFSAPHTFTHALVTRLTPTSVSYARPHSPSPYSCTHPQHTIYSCPATKEETLDFDYCVYALGSRLPAPIDVWGNGTHGNYGGRKEEGVQYLMRMQKRVEEARSVLVIGGGALGIQFASDIAALYGPSKHVTLLHSRHALLPRFEEELGGIVLSHLSALGVNVVLGERVDLETLHTEKYRVKIAGSTLSVGNGHAHGMANGAADANVNGVAVRNGTANGEDDVARVAEEEERVVRTVKGREVRAELVLLCTGQTPNTALLGELLPEAIVPFGESKGMIRVRRTLQIAVPRPVLPLSDALTRDSEDAQDACPQPYREEVDDEEIQLEVGDDGLDTAYAHIFAIGDAADAFGAINAGHNAHWQAEVAARNILRLVHGETEIEQYVPGPPAIKVSLGLNDSAYQFNGEVGTKSGCAVDLDARGMWEHFGWKGVKDEELLL